ncbi:hypothetical protein CANTEDRAFT_91737 [Yamadazyma tenuis ATCC 10573]|uniref:Uncharacterized protein n=1 Tax=Candida tenuis (strain ATCC 10573 / BCRC 21748 / CBS 615 / JCM 9827 / NBRC 10315 / NRRL Y-1498 / VKM Y-70) TaxID=590646 RepID=G3AWM0_CANTC|nr:uncharacterized protein CANTEDRAFT_91737 [Yamadazyma tenuis ATCC 10573]EGV66567.1 hypothetical protein CANTEDRAFT_91737 [Yamadazyma tenuis ATCC 10573]
MCSSCIPKGVKTFTSKFTVQESYDLASELQDNYKEMENFTLTSTKRLDIDFSDLKNTIPRKEAAANTPQQKILGKTGDPNDFMGYNETSRFYGNFSNSLLACKLQYSQTGIEIKGSGEQSLDFSQLFSVFSKAPEYEETKYNLPSGHQEMKQVASFEGELQRKWPYKSLEN